VSGFAEVEVSSCKQRPGSAECVHACEQKLREEETMAAWREEQSAARRKKFLMRADAWQRQRETRT
jgi:hypothetical protein